jgi:hypothetical protein
VLRRAPGGPRRSSLSSVLPGPSTPPRFTVIVLLPSSVSGLVITSDINRSSARANSRFARSSRITSDAGDF